MQAEDDVALRKANSATGQVYMVAEKTCSIRGEEEMMSV